MDLSSQESAPQWAIVLLDRVHALEGLTQTLQARLDSRERQRNRLPDIPTFEGIRKEYKAWVAQLRAKLQIDMEDDLEYVRFWYCHSRLREKALLQVTPWVTSLGDKAGTVAELCSLLNAAYDTREEVDSGEQDMLLLQQKGRPFAVYLAEFERSLIAANEVLWPDRVKRLFFESGFSKELRTALIPVKKPENFGDYVDVVKRVALDLERSKGKVQWSTGNGFMSGGSKGTAMDWETAPEIRIGTLGVESGSVRAKRVSKDILDARKA